MRTQRRESFLGSVLKLKYKRNRANDQVLTVTRQLGLHCDKRTPPTPPHLKKILKCPKSLQSTQQIYLNVEIPPDLQIFSSDLQKQLSHHTAEPCMLKEADKWCPLGFPQFGCTNDACVFKASRMDAKEMFTANAQHLHTG